MRTMTDPARNRYRRDASHRLTFELPKVEAGSYRAICQELEKKFNLRSSSALISGFDEVFQDYSLGSETVGLEWDVWTGFTVVAKTPESEALVKRIGEYLADSKWAQADLSMDDASPALQPPRPPSTWLAVFEGLGASLLGAAICLLTAVVGSAILWKIFACPTAPASWSDTLWVAVTNATWMGVHGLTIGLWLTTWRELRLGGIRGLQKIWALLGFCACVFIVGWVVETVMAAVRTDYVVMLHQAFGSALGILGLLKPRATNANGRLRWILGQSIGAGICMALILAALGVTLDIVLVNLFMYAAIGFGILFGAHLGVNQGLQRWIGRNPAGPGAAGRMARLMLGGIWTGAWTGGATFGMLCLCAALNREAIQGPLALPFLLTLFLLPISVACCTSLMSTQAKGPPSGRLGRTKTLVAGGMGAFALCSALFGLGFLNYSGYSFSMARLALAGCLPLFVAWCLWWACEAIWRERSPSGP